MAEKNINIKILDKNYAINVESDEKEASVRNAANKINEQAKFFSGYRSENIDILAFIALENTSRLMANEKNSIYKDGELIKELEEIDKLLSNRV